MHSSTESPIMSGSTSPRHRPAHLQSQIHQGVVSRATVDSTLAVIPAEAFRRLTKKFPTASSHIVQGVIEMLVTI
jgi:lysophospholipid hydrolase